MRARANRSIAGAGSIPTTDAPSAAAWRAAVPGPQPMSTTFAPFQNVFLHESNDGSWTDRGWFDSLVYRTCKAAARGTKVPEEVLDEFGLCDRLIFTIGG